MPVPGLWGSDLIEQRPEFFRVMQSPFTGEKVVCVKSLNPDYSIIHVQEADEYGNCRILGPSYQDALLARAAKKTIVTTERLVGTYRMQEEPKLTAVPHFLVEAVVVVPGGAKPGICYPEYQKVDDAGMKAYTKAIKGGTMDEYLAGVTEGRF